jgi:hypothetical protein
VIIRSRSLRGLFLRKLPITTSRGHHKITGLNIAYDLFCHRISFDRVPQSHGDHIQLINRCTAMTYFNIGVRTTSVSDAVQEVSMMTSGMSKTYLKFLAEFAIFIIQSSVFINEFQPFWIGCLQCAFMDLQSKQFHQSTSPRLHRCFRL